MFIKIGTIEITKSFRAQYTAQSFSESSIGIRGHVQSESDIALTEQQLYSLREGRSEQVEIQTDDGKVWKGLFRINELSWRKERKSDNSLRAFVQHWITEGVISSLCGVKILNWRTRFHLFRALARLKCTGNLILSRGISN